MQGRPAVSTVLLLHAGIADSRMWRPQVEALQAAGYRVIAPDLRGFGEHRLDPVPFSYVRDVEELIDGPTAVVGNSQGGRVALELAVHRADLVERLVLIAPGLPGWEWSDETREGWAAEEGAYEAGDLEGAAEASVRMWVDGPNRSREEVDDGVRALVTEMVLRSYEMQQGAWEAGAREDDVLDPRSAPAWTRSAVQLLCWWVRKTSRTCEQSLPRSPTPSPERDSSASQMRVTSRAWSAPMR